MYHESEQRIRGVCDKRRLYFAWTDSSLAAIVTRGQAEDSENVQVPITAATEEADGMINRCVGGVALPSCRTYVE